MDNLKGKKVYFPVESLVGLGHFNRAGKIVREMVRNGMDVTVASGTFVDRERFFEGAHCIDMPAHVFQTKDGVGYQLAANGQRTIVPNFNRAAWSEARIQQHLRNIDALKPDVFISEFWPFDRSTFDPEMQAILQTLPKQDKDCLRLVSVRDVLDKQDGDVAAHEARTIDIINNHFDAVLVHGDPTFVPLEETFGAAGDLRKAPLYTGYITDDLPARGAIDPQGPLVVSCGSGVDGEEMIFSFLTAWQRLVERREVVGALAPVTDRPVHIICGPRFSEIPFSHVNEWVDKINAAGGQGIKVERYRDDFTSVLAGAAFSISLAGYNTTLETLALGVPALMIPKYTQIGGKIRMSTEQLYRLERLSEQGLAHFARPEEVQHSSTFAALLVQTMIEQLNKPAQSARLDFQGAAHTLDAISRLIAEREEPRVSRNMSAALARR